MARRVAVVGPPQSGKSVLNAVLRASLPQDQYAMVEAAPDGEGITGWSHDGDADLARTLRRKGKFLPEHVAWVVDSIRHSTAPLTIADLGGYLMTEDGQFTPLGTKLTPQNREIVAECDSIIVIASPKYAQAVDLWINACAEVGAKPLVILESVLEGAEDEIWERDGEVFRGRITGLDRNHPPFGSATAKAVAEFLNDAAGEASSDDGSERADVNFPRLAEALALPVREGGPNREWPPASAQGLLALTAASVAGKSEVNLWGNSGAGWPYHVLACGLDQRVRYYDPKTAMGYVPIPEVATADTGSGVLNWKVEEREGISFVEFIIPNQVFPVGSLPLVIPPAVASERVVISGKGPWWLTGTIARAYAKAGHDVAVLAPRESARVLSSGQKWLEVYPGCVPAIVVASREPQTPVGTILPLPIPTKE